jgi:hypothetical protein
MKRLCSAILLVGVVVLPARAQILWVLPDKTAGGKPSARVTFSRDLKPGQPDLLRQIGRVQVVVRGAGPEALLVNYAQEKDTLLVTDVGKGVSEVICLCRHGVTGPGKGAAALSNYYAKTYVGLAPRQMPPVGYLAEWDRMPLDVVPILDEEIGFQVQAVWRGRPLAGCAYTLLVPGRERPVEGRADGDGVIRLEPPGASGLYGICIRHAEDRVGEYEGRKYQQVRHYSTMTFPVLVGR